MPAAALLLGWAGVVPFAALALASLFGPAPAIPEPHFALALYGAIILSFMGGAQWGLATAARRGEGTEISPQRFGISVLPALWAWGCTLLLPLPWALAGLAAGFAALLAYDLSTVRAGLAPSWYAALRIQLTAAVVILLLAALI